MSPNESNVPKVMIQFEKTTVLPGQCIKEGEGRVADWITKTLSMVNPGVWEMYSFASVGPLKRRCT